MGTTAWWRRPAAIKSLRLLAKNEEGIALIEYALLAALIALAIIGAVTGLGGKVGQHWNDVDSSIPS